VFVTRTLKAKVRNGQGQLTYMCTCLDILHKL